MTIMLEKMKRTFINSQKKILFEPTCSFITIILLLYTIICFGMLSAISNAKERKKRKKKLLSIVMINKHTIIENMCLLINNIFALLYYV